MYGGCLRSWSLRRAQSIDTSAPCTTFSSKRAHLNDELTRWNDRPYLDGYSDGSPSALADTVAYSCRRCAPKLVGMAQENVNDFIPLGIAISFTLYNCEIPYFEKGQISSAPSNCAPAVV